MVGIGALVTSAAGKLELTAATFIKGSARKEQQGALINPNVASVDELFCETHPEAPQDTLVVENRDTPIRAKNTQRVACESEWGVSPLAPG